MNGILTKNEYGEWVVKWSDLHSFGYGTHWMFTKLSSESNSIKYLKDGQIMVKPLEVNLNVEFEMVTSGYDENNFTPFNSAKLIFTEVDEFEKIKMSEQIKIELSFTMEEMEDFLLYNYPKNYHWKDRVKKDVMVYGNDIVVEDIKEEFIKCFKKTLLSQKLNGSQPTLYR
jgi:hypothetical protein